MRQANKGHFKFTCYEINKFLVLLISVFKEKNICVKCMLGNIKGQKEELEIALARGLD
jgi:ribosomal protein S9